MTIQYYTYQPNGNNVEYETPASATETNARRGQAYLGHAQS